MARQSPDLHVAGTTAAGNIGPVPAANSPGHHPDHEQDRPDLDAFAARFSGRDLDDLPTDTGVLDDSYGTSAGRPSSRARALRRWGPPIAGLAVLAAGVTILVRRRRA